MSSTQPTAAIIVIGDEILKGQTVDTNSTYATKLFFSLGIKVCKIIVIGDDINEISSEVSTLSQQYTFVITSGGVGPTHDDVTYEGISAAFNLELEFDTELGNIIKVFYNGSKDIRKNPAMKMAWVPKDHELLYVGGKPPKQIVCWSPLAYPVVKVRNVYIFPGIPECFEASISGLQHSFPSLLGSRYCDIIYLTLDEVHIVPELNATMSKFSGLVTIGSYPVLGNSDYCTKITIETSSAKILNDVVKFLKSQVPQDSIVDMAPDNLVVAALLEVKHLACYEHVQHAFEVSIQIVLINLWFLSLMLI